VESERSLKRVRGEMERLTAERANTALLRERIEARAFSLPPSLPLFLASCPLCSPPFLSLGLGRSFSSAFIAPPSLPPSLPQDLEHGKARLEQRLSAFQEKEGARAVVEQEQEEEEKEWELLLYVKRGREGEREGGKEG